MNGWKDSKGGGRVLRMPAPSGRPSTVTYFDVKVQIDKRIRHNRRISTDEN
jgi:hypothetical protein